MKWKWWLMAGAAGALLGAGWLAMGETGAPQEPTPETVSVARRDVSATVMAMGVVRPRVGAQVKVGCSRVSGVVRRLRANIGEPIEAGQVIAELDAAEFRTRLAQSEALLERARAEADGARRRLEWLRPLV